MPGRDIRFFRSTPTEPIQKAFYTHTEQMVVRTDIPVVSVRMLGHRDPSDLSRIRHKRKIAVHGPHGDRWHILLYIHVYLLRRRVGFGREKIIMNYSSLPGHLMCPFLILRMIIILEIIISYFSLLSIGNSKLFRFFQNCRPSADGVSV